MQLAPPERALVDSLATECDCDVSLDLGLTVESVTALGDMAADTSRLALTFLYDPLGAGDRGSLCFRDSVDVFLAGAAVRALDATRPRGRYTSADVLMSGSRIDRSMVVEDCVRIAEYDRAGTAITIREWHP